MGYLPAFLHLLYCSEPFCRFSSKGRAVVVAARSRPIRSIFQEVLIRPGAPLIPGMDTVAVQVGPPAASISKSPCIPTPISSVLMFRTLLPIPSAKKFRRVIRLFGIRLQRYDIRLHLSGDDRGRCPGHRFCWARGGQMPPLVSM